jgi:hypothetical protein
MILGHTKSTTRRGQVRILFWVPSSVLGFGALLALSEYYTTPNNFVLGRGEFPVSGLVFLLPESIPMEAALLNSTFSTFMTANGLVIGRKALLEYEAFRRSWRLPSYYALKNFNPGESFWKSRHIPMFSHVWLLTTTSSSLGVQFLQLEGLPPSMEVQFLQCFQLKKKKPMLWVPLCWLQLQHQTTSLNHTVT